MVMVFHGFHGAVDLTPEKTLGQLGSMGFKTGDVLQDLSVDPGTCNLENPAPPRSRPAHSWPRTSWCNHWAAAFWPRPPAQLQFESTGSHKAPQGGSASLACIQVWKKSLC